MRVKKYQREKPGRWYLELLEYEVTEYGNGSRYWSLNGGWHREAGPAVEYADGSKYWYLNGQLHREDGPACEYWDGRKDWFLHGVEFTEEEWEAEIKCLQSQK